MRAESNFECCGTGRTEKSRSAKILTSKYTRIVNMENTEQIKHFI